MLLLLLVAAVDPVELLERIAERYAAATDYDLLVESTTSNRTDGGADKYRYSLAASWPRRLFASEESLRNEKFELSLGADGQSSWAWDPRGKRYTRNSGEVLQLKQIHHRFFHRFALLARMPGVTAAARGYAKVNGVRCQVIRLEAAQEQWTEDLCVDAAAALVRRSVFYSQRDFGLTKVRTTTVWREIRIGPEVPAERFQFTPPDGARRTNLLEWR
ncbi:MAG: DUF2092 domain-containing protein [Bryobacteraceae bacterium]|nr:DUF2092 domain-containing protein [Bryobacteraceae bacterium]